MLTMGYGTDDTASTDRSRNQTPPNQRGKPKGKPNGKPPAPAKPAKRKKK